MPQRVLIAGVTGVGKSTLGKRLSELWDLPYTNLDKLHWGPGWTERPTFREEALTLAASGQWITEWQYGSKGIRQVLAERADTLIWLNLPRRIALPRLYRRTFTRWLSGEEAYQGCRERAPWTAFTDENHIFRWEIKTHGNFRKAMPAQVMRYPHITFIELRTPSEVRRWLAGPVQGHPGDA
ncbi:P-loop NTPase family protein [Nesterenkonia ebinurensis]|uniref:AAA family ATPase n=1 Tax=Nesterenkonia ebinurensis TaxID=2608252 RepID=UPI00123E071B|nr:AAA family ATPase [Nesterenkonia ebinurensis]